MNTVMKLRALLEWADSWKAIFQGRPRVIGTPGSRQVVHDMR